MRRVITYGTFDMLHYGHINLLKRAKEMGDYLIVALSTDEFNWHAKQKKTYFSYEKRKQLLEAIRYVDLVIPEESWNQKTSDVKLYQVDTFVMGMIGLVNSILFKSKRMLMLFIWHERQKFQRHRLKKT